MRKSSFHNITKNKRKEDVLSEKLLRNEKFKGEVFPTTIRLPIELHAQFKTIVSKKKKKMGDVYTDLIKAYVEKEKNK